MRPRNVKDKRTRRIVTPRVPRPDVNRVDAELAAMVTGDGPRERREREGMRLVGREHCECAAQMNLDDLLGGTVRKRNEEMCMPVGCEVVCKKRRTEEYWTKRKAMEQPEGQPVGSRKAAKGMSRIQEMFVAQREGPGVRRREEEGLAEGRGGEPWQRVVRQRGERGGGGEAGDADAQL